MTGPSCKALLDGDQGPKRVTVDHEKEEPPEKGEAEKRQERYLSASPDRIDARRDFGISPVFVPDVAG